MGVSQENLNRAVSAARARESQGYFARVKAGDQRAASLFARLVAFDLNPSGMPTDYGWLSKSPGESQVDGYAEDAIVLGNDPNDLANVVDLVNGAGAPGASIGGSVKERRPNNKWVKPQALSESDMAYLLDGGQPVPLPPTVTFPPRNETMAAFDACNQLYKDKGRRDRTLDEDSLYMDNEGMSVWQQQYLMYRVIQGKSHADALTLTLADIEAAWPK